MGKGGRCATVRWKREICAGSGSERVSAALDARDGARTSG